MRWNGPDEKLYANVSGIAHFNNNRWDILNTDAIIGNVVHLYKNKSDGKIYLRVATATNHIDSTLIYEYTQSKYDLLYGNIGQKGFRLILV